VWLGAVSVCVCVCVCGWVALQQLYCTVFDLLLYFENGSTDGGDDD
jgi:hypothetical protein